MPAGRYALLIASSEYHDQRFRRLRAPATDTAELAEVLRDSRIGGYQVVEMLDTPAHSASEEIEAFLKERDPSDLLLLYFSCHGVKDERGQLHFATTTTKLDRLASTGIAASFVAEQMYQSRSRQIVLLLDCCYSGAFTRGMTRRAGEQVELDSFAGRGHAVLFASSAMEYAFEVDGTNLTESPVASLFTRTIVHGLRTGEADLDGDGLISVGDLYDHVLAQVRAITPNQTPGKLVDAYGEIYIANSVRAAFDLGLLRHEIRAALASPLAGIRKGVIDELEPLLDVGSASMRHAARAALMQLFKDDNSRVSSAAAAALGFSASQLPEEQQTVIDTASPDSASGRHGGALSDTRPTTSPMHVEKHDPDLHGKDVSEREAMAHRIDKIQFSTTRLRPGYEEKEVDAFLDALRDTFAGVSMEPLRPADVRTVQFGTTRFRTGYDEEEVDAFLDEVELKLSTLPNSANSGFAAPSGSQIGVGVRRRPTAQEPLAPAVKTAEGARRMSPKLLASKDRAPVPADGQVAVAVGVARYHRPTCRRIRSLVGSDQAGIMTRSAAESDGYLPCRACKPNAWLAES
jgi:DivIVA domain-containing protein